MSLSPLTAALIRDRQQSIQERRNDLPDADDREWAKKYLRYKCQECGETHGYRHDAEMCCPPEVEAIYVNPVTDEEFDNKAALLAALQGSDPDAPILCPVCGGKGVDEHDAANCCLWRDFEPMRRFAIATAVERGVSWDDAIKQAGRSQHDIA